MRKRWILMNELFFSVYRTKDGSTVRVTFSNADKRDETFMSLIARLIEAWTMARRKRNA